MNLKMMEQFEVMDEVMLSNIEGGVSLLHLCGLLAL